MNDVEEVDLDVGDEDDLDLEDVEPDADELEESFEELEAAELDEDFGDDGAAVLDPEPAGDPDELVTAADVDADDAAADPEDADEVSDVSETELDEDDADEGLREGEFICASCYLAKGPTQLANAKRNLCVDCV